MCADIVAFVIVKLSLSFCLSFWVEWLIIYSFLALIIAVILIFSITIAFGTRAITCALQ